MIVIDASIAAKLYREEPGSVEAAELLAKYAGAISVPDVFAIEVAGVIVRDANAYHGGAPLQQDKLLHFAELLQSPAIELVRSDTSAVLRASQMAMALGHPLKDCVYLVLARDLACPLVTADLKFLAKAQGLHPQIWPLVRQPE